MNQQIFQEIQALKRQILPNEKVILILHNQILRWNSKNQLPFQ